MPRKGDASLHGDLVTAGVVIAAVAFAALTGLYLADVYVFDRSLAALDLEEGALVTWATSSAAFAVAFVAFLLSFFDATQRVRLAVITCIVAFVSFDDAAVVHERVAQRVAVELELADTYVQVIWPLLYLPLLATAAALLLRFAHETPVAHRLVVAGLLALVAAVGLEIVSVALDRADFGPDSLPRVLEVAVEEGLEVVGWILVATGATIRLLALVERRQNRYRPAGLP